MLLANSVDPDQTAQMRRLIWIYAGRKCDKGPFVMHWLIFEQERENNVTKSIKM